MANLSVDTADFNGETVNFVAAAAGGDSVPFNARTVLLVNNEDAAGKTIHLPINSSVLGVDVPNRDVTCPAGEITAIRLGSQMIDPTTGRIEVTYSSVTNVSVAVLLAR